MVDFSDLENPIQYYLDLDNYIIINPEYMVTKEVFIQKNTYQIFDDVFGLGSEKKTYNHAVQGDQRLNGTIKNAMGLIGGFEIRLSTTGTAYEVTTYSISDMLAQIGGIYELIRTV